MESLKSNPKRQAIQVLDGYSYQIWRSVLCWLKLKSEERLYLEGAEDIDLHQERVNKVETVQVKKTSRAITLNSKSVIEAINNFGEHQQNNPDVQITFRFLTTSKRGKEKSNLFNGICGLDLWDSCKESKTDCTILKNFLVSNNRLSDKLKNFIKKANNEDLRNKLLVPITWDTDNRDEPSIRKQVEEILISYGDKRTLFPSQSIKAIPFLLEYVWEIARHKENRWLTRNDFLRVFEKEIMILVSRTEYNELKEKASKFPNSMLEHLGINQQEIEIKQKETSIFEFVLKPDLNRLVERKKLVEELQNLLDRNKIIVLTGSTGMGKSVLACHLATSTNDNWKKIDLRGCSTDKIKENLITATRLIGEENEKIDCIIDDLNFDKEVSIYENALEKIILAVKNRDGRIIITSQNSLPTKIENIQNFPKDYLFTVPRLKENEIEELALKHGCPEGNELDSWVRIIAAQSNGHPQLAHAQISSLQFDNWKKPIFEDIIFNQEVEKVKQETRRTLSDLLPNEARKLLYRLSVFLNRFSRHQALAIGETKPKIDLAGEKFELLIGPWIEQTDDTYFRLSPLVSGSATKVFSQKEVKNLNRVAATSFLDKKSIDFFDIHAILMHGLIGENPFPLMILVPNILGVKDEHKQKLFELINWFGYVKTEKDEKFFPSFPLANHMLRKLQFTLLSETNPIKALPVVNNWEQEINQGDDSFGIAGMKSSAMFNFLTDVILEFRVPFSIRKISNWVVQLTLLLEKTEKFYPEHPEAESEFRLSIKELAKPEIYVRAAIARCKNYLEIFLLLDTFEKSNNEASKKIWKILDQEIDLATSIVDKIWLDELKKSSQNWEICLKTLDWIIELAKRNKIAALIGASYRAKAIIYEEYLKDSEIALQQLKKGELKIGYSHPFLKDYQARLLIFREKYKDALAILNPLLEHYESIKYNGRFLAYQDAETCAGRLGNWKEASNFALKGKNSLEQPSISDNDFELQNIDRTLLVGFHADYAYALWRDGQRKLSILEFASILDSFQNLPDLDENVRTRMLNKRVGYAINWILNNEIRGQESSFIPPPSWFSDFNEYKDVINETVGPITYLWSFLATIEYELKLGKEIFNQFKEKCSNQEDLVSKGILYNLQIKHSLNKLDAENIVFHYVNLSRNAKGIIGLNRTPISNWNDDTSLKRLTFSALSLIINKEKQKEIPLADWQNTLSENELLSEEMELWFKYLEESIDTNNSTLSVILKNQNELPEKRVLAALFLSTTNVHLDPETRFYANIILLTTDYLYDWQNELEDTIEKLFTEKWRQIAESQRFALRTPNITVPSILSVCNDNKIKGIPKAAKILISANNAVTLRIDKNLLNQLSNLAQINKTL